MKILKPMRWSEGMFLKPQHFQQFDMYLEARESNRLDAVESYGWGLSRLQIDESALENFVFDPVELRAVLPNGTFVDIPGNAKVASRSFEGVMKEPGQALDVSIGVKAHEDRGPLTASNGASSGDTRYLGSEEEIYDLDAGRDPIPLEKLTYNMRIFVGAESRDGYETLPVARLVLTGDIGKPVRLDPRFSPPALLLVGSPVLHGAARGVVERLALVLRDLGQMRGSSDPEPLILYYGLAGLLPVLKDMVQEGQVHPRRAYQEMARLAGALYFRDKEGRSPEEIPAYDHRDPGPVFESLRRRIVELSELVIERAYRRCPMVRDGELFHVVLPAEAKQPGARFYLEVEADDSTPKLRMLMMTSKVSNPGRIDTLRDHALPGVPTEPQPTPPAELPPGQTGSYFRLRHEETEWGTHVAPAGELTVFMLGAPQDVKINLIVIPAGS